MVADKTRRFRMSPENGAQIDLITTKIHKGTKYASLNIKTNPEKPVLP